MFVVERSSRPIFVQSMTSSSLFIFTRATFLRDLFFRIWHLSRRLWIKSYLISQRPGLYFDNPFTYSLFILNMGQIGPLFVYFLSLFTANTNIAQIYLVYFKLAGITRCCPGWFKWGFKKVFECKFSMMTHVCWDSKTLAFQGPAGLSAGL